MITYFQKRFVLSRDGARSLLKGIICTTLLNIALMLPAVFVFLFLSDYLQASFGKGITYYIALAILFLCITFVIALLQYKSTYTKIYTESANRRIGIAEKLRLLPLAFFGEKNLSDLTSTVMEDNTILETLFSHSIPQLFASIISMLLIILGLFFYQWQLALALFWVVPLAALIIWLGKKLMDRSNLTFYHTKRTLTEQIQEGLENIQEIKAYNGEKEYMHQLDENLKQYEKVLLRGELIGGVLVNSAAIILKLGLASVVLAGAYLFLSGNITLLTYLIFLMVSSSIYNPIQEVFINIAVLSLLDVRINRMREIEEMPTQHGKTDYHLKNYDIEFKNVYFSYDTDKQVLKDVSFTARQGQVTALVGPSGGGKSTSAKLAARFWDIDKGTITLGGEDISQIDPEALLKNYAVVFQDVLLFNASIADNIRIGKKDASDDEIRRVAELSCCQEFIDRMPQGYDTLIGENGETLSGGERQRISIARALLKDAPIVLLDEATASLDVENETKIQTALSALVKNKTVLIIAHRMRTVANVHHIVVLKDGMVAESGSPTQLIAQNGYYKTMCDS